jgi:hypothetical protein
MLMTIAVIDEKGNTKAGADFLFPLDDLKKMNCYDFGKDKRFLMVIDVILNEIQNHDEYVEKDE